MNNCKYVRQKLHETIQYWKKQLNEGNYIEDSDDQDFIEEDFVFDVKPEAKVDSDAEVLQILSDKSKTKIDISTIPFKLKRRLTSIDIPYNITEIGNDAFNGCNSLKHVKIPSTVVSIGRRAFQDCIELVDLEFEEDDSELNDIGPAAFMNCVNLKNVVIPWNVSNIGKLAFSGCYRLKTIYIPNAVQNIGENAFNECRSIDDIAFNGKTEDEIILMDNFPFGLIKCKTISIN